jgi:hypothetical protein
MFGQHLLISTGIGGLSTGVYATFTHDNHDYRDRKNEYISIFCIILFVSFIMLFLFNNNSENLVTTNSIGNISSTVNGGKPPF